VDGTVVYESRRFLYELAVPEAGLSMNSANRSFEVYDAYRRLTSFSRFIMTSNLCADKC
jgi:hypothetical protein